MEQLGTKIGKVLTPIAAGLGMPCVDADTKQLRPESACNERIFLLNEKRYVDAFFTFFRSSNKQTNGEEIEMDNNKPQLMQYAVIIGVEAEDVEDAIAKSKDSSTKKRIIACNPAPQPRAPVPQGQQQEKKQ